MKRPEREKKNQHSHEAVEAIICSAPVYLSLSALYVFPLSRQLTEGGVNNTLGEDMR